ncbi:MAG: type transport system permease protein [Frankiales bacterium]|nr:type transport system permease protein [Frankiales bacterium]
MTVTTMGSHGGLAGAPPAEAVNPRTGAAVGYNPGHTLPLRVEVIRQLRRRRTQLGLGFLVILPFLLLLAFKAGGPDNGGGAPGLVDLATVGAPNFTLFTLFASTGFLLVVIVALFAGDTVAAEASWSSLRYLLAAPIPRSRLLRQKLVVALGYGFFAIVLLTAVALLAGWIGFGWHAARSPLGTSLPTGTAFVRLLIVIGYLAVVMLFVAALAFLLGVYTDAPLGAVGGAVVLVIVSNILDAVTALGSLRQALPTHYQYSWVDALGPSVAWDSMTKGALWSIGYSIVLFGLAWRHFLRKDVLS